MTHVYHNFNKVAEHVFSSQRKRLLDFLPKKKKCLPANLALITKKATHHIICPMKFEISDYNLQHQNFSDFLEGEYLRFLPSLQSVYEYKKISKGET